MSQQPQNQLSRPPPAPAWPYGPNVGVVELTTQSTHDAIVGLKDDYPTSVEDPDRTFGNFTEKEAKKSIHQEYQIITLLSAAGGPHTTLSQIARKRMAKVKAYNSTLRGIGGAERDKANESRQVNVPPPAPRNQGMFARILHRTGARTS